MTILEQISTDVYDGELDDVVSHIKQALAEGITPKDVLDNGLLDGMDKVGEDFKNGELFVPEVLLSAKTMDAGMIEIKPLLNDEDVTSKGVVVMATVKGDLHDIGKKLVCMMLEGAGFTVHDLGVDVPPEAIVDAVKEYQPDIVGMSAMLTTTLLATQDSVELLRKDATTHDVKIMIGGAPANPDMATEMGANYSPDASAAVELAVALLDQ